jgi:RimJ/RimL family protein N-acetyltransferase
MSHGSPSATAPSPFGPTLHTARLLLRPPQPADFEPWAAMMQDEQVARFIGGVQPPSLAWRGLMAMIGAWVATGVSMFSVLERGSGRWIGRVGPWQPHGWPGPEVGWSLAREAWGRGYATEAAAAAMDYSVDVLGWQEIIHTIDPANTASQRVAMRLGSWRRGPGRLPPPHHEAPVEIWGQMAAEWRLSREHAAQATADLS